MGNNVSIIINKFNDTAIIGATCSLDVTCVNDGTTIWNTSQYHCRLHYRSDTEYIRDYPLNGYFLSSPVSPGNSVDFHLVCERKNYGQLEVQMVQEMVEWFGDKAIQLLPQLSEVGNSGHITIFPSAYDSIGQGTWVWQSRTTSMGGWIYNPSNTDGDEISYKITLSPGTYTLHTMMPISDNRGIRKYYIDDIEIASFDGYNAVGTYDILKKQTGIIILKGGLKTLKIKCVGKNPLSLGYYIHFHTISLWRTG